MTPPPAESAAPSGPAPPSAPSGRTNPGIEVARLLAVASIVLAHFKPWATGGAMNAYASLMEVLGNLGVPLFFALSGYLFRPRPEQGLLRYVAGRRYLAPWLVCGTAGYLFIIFQHGWPYVPVNHLDWLIGNPSIYFFLTLLLVFEVFTRLVREASPAAVLGIALLLALGSTSYAATRVLPNPNGFYAGISQLLLNLNPLNFYVYYALGRLLAAGGGLAARARSGRWALLGLFGLLLAAKVGETWWLVSHGRPWLGYFSPLMVLLGGALILAAHGLLTAAPDPPGWLRRLASLGVYTFPVYLLHPIAVAVLDAAFRAHRVPMVPWHLAAVAAILAGLTAVAALARKVLPAPVTRTLIGA